MMKQMKFEISGQLGNFPHIFFLHLLDKCLNQNDDDEQDERWTKRSYLNRDEVFRRRRWGITSKSLIFVVDLDVVDDDDMKDPRKKGNESEEEPHLFMTRFIISRRRRRRTKHT